MAKYVLDELFVPGAPYRVIHGLADPETQFQLRETRPDQSTDDSNTLIQLDTPSTPPPSISSCKRKRESAYFDSPSGCYIFSEFDKDGIPRRPRKLRKLRFKPSFTPRHDNTPQLICHDHPSDDFNPFLTVANTSAKVCQIDDHAVANATVGPPSFSNSAHQSSTSKAVQCHQTNPPPDRSYFSVDRIHRNSQKPEVTKPVYTIDFSRLPTAHGRTRFPGVDLRSGNFNCPLTINKLSDKIEVTSGNAVVNDDRPARKITFASHALVRLYRNRSDADGSQDSNPKPHADTTPDVITGSSSDNVKDHLETSEGSLFISENPTERLGEATDPCPPECPDNTTLTENDTKPKIFNPFCGTSEDNSRVLTLDVQQVLDFRNSLKKQHPKCELPSGQLAMLFELRKGYAGMEFRHEW